MTTAWMQVLSGLAEETDYDNFKSEVAHHQGMAGAAYVAVCVIYQTDQFSKSALDPFSNP